MSPDAPTPPTGTPPSGTTPTGTTPPTGTMQPAGTMPPAGTTAGTPPVGTTPELREEAAMLAEDAGKAGRRVADVAKEETKSVASETRRQARQLADQASNELRDQAAVQQRRVASGLRAVGSQFSQMAESSTESGYATDIVRQAGNSADEVARWLDARDPGSLLEEVKGFARRRPGVFLAIALGAGVIAGRMTRALTAPAEDELTSGTSRGGLPTGTARPRAAVPTSPSTPIFTEDTDAATAPFPGERFGGTGSTPPRGGL
ncbi:hypothetical protein [Agromyces albus]|uniref:ATP synthase F0 subunit B n=1 Tax=Agromyces albus TaxID=205332 RepID=A0A4Q2L7D6_9MICO|nr:hypothetical protein [Agromyces albus]RXZ72453.1 hypothetical protein ESP51_04640 [Agromyces albus]